MKQSDLKRKSVLKKFSTHFINFVATNQQNYNVNVLVLKQTKITTNR